MNKSRIVPLMLTVLLLIISVAFGDVRDSYLRIGIQFASSGLSSYAINYQSPVSLNTYGQSTLNQLGVLDASGQFLFGKNSFYMVVSSVGFPSVNEAKSTGQAIGLSHQGYYYDGELKLVEGLYNSQSEAEVAVSNAATKYSDISFVLIMPQSNHIIAKGGGVNVVYADTAPLVLMSQEAVPYYQINGTTYRGGAMIQGVGQGAFGGLNHVNVQPIDTYLYGVLPKEMAYNWPMEALKAQAVAARNFAVLSMNKHKAYGFDVCTTTDCQVYGGLLSEKPECSQAVDETKGLMIYSNGVPISAFYHSNSGGATENSENVWVAVLSYIRGKSDPYSLDAPNSNWILSYSYTAFSEALKKGGYDVGVVNQVRVDKRTTNGRVASVTVLGSKGSFTFEKEKLRTVLGATQLKSMYFEIQEGSQLSVLTKNGIQLTEKTGIYTLSASGLNPLVAPYTKYNGSSYVKGTLASDDLTLIGRGYGHGLGMSQWGAKKMAESGYSFEEILKFYYSAVEIY